MTTDRQAHWQGVYSSKGEKGVSWYEDRPELSLDLIRRAGVGPEASILDVGGGASRLVDALVARGQSHVTVLDLSAAALELARSRLSDVAHVDWVVGDVTDWAPSRTYDLWHDRAAFHFLVDPADQVAYATVLSQALRPGGIAIIGTFSLSGPEKCSGLPVVRHDAASLQRVLGPGFTLLSSEEHSHRTPGGTIQDFQFSTFQKSSP